MFINLKILLCLLSGSLSLRFIFDKFHRERLYKSPPETSVDCEHLIGTLYFSGKYLRINKEFCLIHYDILKSQMWVTNHAKVFSLEVPG